MLKSVLFTKTNRGSSSSIGVSVKTAGGCTDPIAGSSSNISLKVLFHSNMFPTSDMFPPIAQ